MFVGGQVPEARSRPKRDAWSQGAVPFLVIVTPDGVRSCDATRYQTNDWDEENPLRPWRQEALGGTISLPDDVTSLQHLAAIRVGVSVGLGPARSGHRFGRVDKLLLDGLRALGKELTGDGPNGGLDVSTANRLLSTCLYLYCLADRGILTQELITGRGHDGIMLNGRDDWDVIAFGRLMADLETVFNGGVFRFQPEAMAQLGGHHLSRVRSLLKHGAIIKGGRTQLSFLDIDLSVLRTETLSSVYEMLFENQGEGRREEDGAFYTPAYLVDYVLGQVDRTCRIAPGARVIDCAAGSGVFLVGAFRRMLERTLEETGERHIPLDRSRRILSECIFGIERNEDAANVAAFSLFLTMLDYARPATSLVAEMINGGGTVFPLVIDHTILVRDLFEKGPLPANFAEKFDVLLGNPPWQKVRVIGPEAERALIGLRRRRPGSVDRDRAAELFFWTGYDAFLREGGTFGLVLSAKSFLSPGANSFPRAFLAGATVTGFANLTHLRRRLFPGAEHPAIAVFGMKRKPERTDPVWIHYPLLASLPLDASGSPWCLVRDTADVELRIMMELDGPEGVFRTLMLKPVDRRMVDYLDDACKVGNAATLEELCRLTGLYLGRGSSPALTKLPAAKLLGTKPGNDWRVGLGLAEPKKVVPKKGRKIKDQVPYSFDGNDLDKTVEPYSSLFAGDMVIIPRSFKNVTYVEEMFGFNSSLIGLCFKRDGSPIGRKRRDFLEAMTLYLQSSFARYAAALYGRMWMIDRRRFEAGDMARLPVPFRSVGDVRVAAIRSAARDGMLEEEILRQFGVEGPLAEAVREYGKFRASYENGILPAAAHKTPDDESRDVYATTLEEELQNGLTDTWCVHVNDAFDETRKIHVVAARFVKTIDEDRLLGKEPPPAPTPASTWFDSLGLSYDPGARLVTLAKPDLYCRWTREQAVSDGRRIMACIHRQVAAA